jgi:putative SOS response-associated peptidase YedK
VRQPYRVVRADGLPLVLAGLWAGWRDPAVGALLRTFTIVTTAADARLVELHHRMPVSLPPRAWDRWLDPSLADPAELHSLLAEGDPEPLEIYPVVRLVNDVRNDGPELLERLAV